MLYRTDRETHPAVAGFLVRSRGALSGWPSVHWPIVIDCPPDAARACWCYARKRSTAVHAQAISYSAQGPARASGQKGCSTAPRRRRSMPATTRSPTRDRRAGRASQSVLPVPDQTCDEHLDASSLSASALPADHEQRRYSPSVADRAPSAAFLSPACVSVGAVASSGCSSTTPGCEETGGDASTGGSCCCGAGIVL